MPTFSILPAVYPTLLSGIAAPVRDRKGVETTLATQPEPLLRSNLSAQRKSDVIAPCSIEWRRRSQQVYAKSDMDGGGVAARP